MRWRAIGGKLSRLIEKAVIVLFWLVAAGAVILSLRGLDVL